MNLHHPDGSPTVADSSRRQWQLDYEFASRRSHNSKGNCQIELQLFPYESTHLFHALAINAQIAVAGAGGGAEVDGLGFIVEQKFDVVNEAKQ